MSQVSLEQYLDNLENLSPELTRNFKLIYDLDTKVHDILIEIDKMKKYYLNNLKSMDTEMRLLKMKEIDKKYELSKKFSDEKVQLANNTCKITSFSKEVLVYPKLILMYHSKYHLYFKKVSF